MSNLQSVFGFCFIIFVAWLLSEDRKRFDLRIVCSGILLQFILALLLLKAPIIKDFLFKLNYIVNLMEKGTEAGTGFVFGYLGGAQPPFDVINPNTSFILAFRALPIVLIVGSLSSLLFYWRILPLIVRGFSHILKHTMGVGGAVGVSSAANVFVGMIEAPLFIRPYLDQLSRSELFTLMTTGMATVAGTVLALYASILSQIIPDSLGQILIASIISLPAAIMISRLMVPETGEKTAGDITPDQEANGTMDAISQGALQGMQLLLPIVAMLIVLVGLVAICNELLALLPDVYDTPLTIQRILGVLMSPVVWLLGVPWAEAQTAGSLMGTKIVLNELIAYIDLANLPQGALSERSRLIMTYAMCGFANFGSLGIMLGGMGAMAPTRKNEIVKLGMRSILSGVLATCMTGAIVGILT